MRLKQVNWGMIVVIDVLSYSPLGLMFKACSALR